MSGWWPGLRPWSAACAVAAPVLLAWGGTLVSRPQASGGPMNLDWSNPAGAALLVVGAALLPDPVNRRRWLVWALGGTGSAVPVLRHLQLYPPFLDGQSYAAYIGVPDPDIWPAAAGYTGFGMVPLALALTAVAPRGAPPATTRALLLRAGPAAALLCCGFEAFNGGLWWLADTTTVRPALLSGCVLVMALSLHWRRWTTLRVLGACALVLLGLSAAMLWLEAAPRRI